MCTSVSLVLIHVALVFSVTVHKKNDNEDIEVKTHIILLEPISVPCILTDIIIISAPIVFGKARYCLTNPRGETRKLDITAPKYNNSNLEIIKINFVNKTTIVTPVNNYKVFNVNMGQSVVWANTEDTFAEREKEMDENDFMIGPVGEEDYGNWEVSAVFRDEVGEWTEVSQIITIDIVETVPATPYLPKLRSGETFELSFAYPIPHLESCQLVVPKSAFDRFYDRQQAKPDTCGYVVKNVSSSDAGLWSIMALGRIGYQSTVFLTVDATDG